MANKEIIKRRNTPIKQRSSSCYHRKVERITNWYNHMVKTRQEKNALGIEKKPLRSLDYFVDKIKKPKGE
jgi:hypothetical protein